MSVELGSEKKMFNLILPSGSTRIRFNGSLFRVVRLITVNINIKINHLL